MTEAAKFRYPGPQEFEDTAVDSGRFFGRDREIASVAEHIAASRLLVVYGASGLGKSSLLKAGVFPKLRDDNNLFPIRVRLDPNVPVIQLIEESCVAAARSAPPEFAIDYTAGKGQTAWEFFQTAMFWRGERMVSPVLVFDQFEEIFTLCHPGWRADFGGEIGPLATGNVPASIRERMLSGEQGLSDQAPKLKLVFCLREEYYGSLQELNPHFPGLFQDRFRLEPLNEKQAQDAIGKPAALTDRDFSTPAFEYGSDAITAMMAFLKGRSSTVEPVPLQLLCQFVERTIVPSKQRAGTDLKVTASDLGSEEAMRKVIGCFYDDSLNHLPPSERKRARELCDTGLLGEAGNRLMLEESQILQTYHLNPGTLRYLTDNRRILRQEPRLESTFYEISHDTIARSIFESRRWRLPKQWRLAMAVSAVFACALIGITVWALLNKSEAERQKIEAVTQKTNAFVQRESAKANETKAKESQRTAEDTVAFLMGDDFLETVRPMGRLDVFEKVGEKIPCQLNAKLQQLDDLGLGNLGLACFNAGGIDYDRLLLTQSAGEYEAARSYFAELARRQGHSSEDLAHVLTQLASIADDRWNFSESFHLTRQSLGIQRQLLANGGVDKRHEDKLLRGEAENYIRLGNLSRKRGYMRDALLQFKNARSLTAANHSAEWLYLQQDVLIGEADALEAQNRGSEAIQLRREAKNCAKEALEKAPFAPQAHYRLAVALAQLPAEDVQMAEYDDIVQRVSNASEWDPENVRLKTEVAATQVLRGQWQIGKLNWNAALADFNAAHKNMAAVRIDPTDRTMLMERLAWLHELQGSAYMQGMKQGDSSRPSEKPKVESTPLQQTATAIKQDDSSLHLVANSNVPGALKEYNEAESVLRLLLQPEVPIDYWDYVRDLNTLRFEALTKSAKTKEAEAASREALQASQHAAAMAPDAVAYQVTLAYSLQQLGVKLLDAGDLRASENQFSQAQTAWRTALRSQNIADYWNRLFLLYYDRFSSLAKKRNDAAAARKAYQISLTYVTKAVQLSPNEPVYRGNLALAEQQVGDDDRDQPEKAGEFFKKAQGHWDSALAHYEAAKKAWEDALQIKESAEYSNRLFLLYYDHFVKLAQKRHDPAPAVQRAYQMSIPYVAKAAQSDPKVAVYQDNLFLAHQQIAALLHEANKDSEAEKEYQLALSAVEKAVVLDPKSFDYHEQKSLTLWRSGQLQADSAQGLESYRKARETLRETVALLPKGSENDVARARCDDGFYVLGHDYIAPILHQQGDAAGELVELKGALDGAVDAARLQKDDVQRQVNLGNAYLGLATYRREHGDLNAEPYAKAEGAFRNAVTLKKDNPDSWNSLAEAIAYQGSALESAGDSTAALAKYRAAREALDTAAQLSPDAATTSMKTLRETILEKLRPHR